MNPRFAALPPACSQIRLSLSEAVERARPAMPALDPVQLVPMEQFIWPSPPSDEPARFTAPRAEPDSLPHILSLLDDEEPTDADAWRRQFISALRDLDREDAAPPPAPEPPSEMPPLLPYVAAPRRVSQRTPVPSRSARLLALAPLTRRTRLRVATPMLGAVAVAALLSVAVPRTTNHPETAGSATSQSMVLAASPHKSVADASDVLGPVMFNAPVLVREGAAPPPPSAMPNVPMPALPVIETVRTVPVFLDRDAGASAPPMPWTPSAGQPLAPMPALQPAPAAAPSPLDRDSLTTLVGRPPAAHPPPPAASETAPAAAAPQKQAEAKPPVDEPHASERAPRISSSYERSAPTATKQARKRPSRATKKASTRTRQAQWQSRRQGLRTAPPPPAEEPSTMVKFLKSLNPFSPKEDDSAAAKSQPGPEKSRAPAAKKDTFWWGQSQSTR
jgi:hypothetical protein